MERSTGTVQTFYFLLLFLFRLFPVLFVVHLLAAPFSSTVRERIKRHPVFNICWFVLSVVVAIVAIMQANGGR